MDFEKIKDTFIFRTLYQKTPYKNYFYVIIQDNNNINGQHKCVK